MTEAQPAAPAPPPQAAEVLAAEGTTITLAGDRRVQLRYTMGSLRLLEARFGSLQGLDREISTAANGRPCPAHAEPEPHPDAPGLTRRSPGHGQAEPACDECVPQGAVFTALSDAIAPGLLHERVVHPDTGQQVRLGKDPDLVAEQLDPGRLQEYMDAWARAFSQAMANLGGRGNAAGAAQAAPSPGLTGTTPPPSPSAAPTGSSGA